MAIGIRPTARTGALDRTQKALNKTLAQLGSLKRITGPQDDAAGLALSENLRAVERSLAQGERNLSDGISVARTAEGALSGISDSLVRMRELTVQAGNGALDDHARQALQSEFDALSAEVTRAAESTHFGSRKLLSGETQGADAIHLRDGTGNGQVLTISLGDSRAAALGVEALDVSDPGSLEAIDQAIGSVVGARADLGTAQTRLESGIRNLQNIREQTTAANSRIADADVARVTAQRARLQLLQHAQVAVHAQANINAGVALQLLK